MSFVVPDELEGSKHLAWGQLHENYGEVIISGVDVGGKVYQMDVDSMGRIATTLAELRSGKVNPHGGFWIDSSNEMVALDDAQATTLLEAIVSSRLSVDQFYLSTRDAINAATTQEELDAIDIIWGGV